MTSPSRVVSALSWLSDRYIDIFEQKIDLFAFETKMRHVITDLIDPQKRRQ